MPIVLTRVTPPAFSLRLLAAHLVLASVGWGASGVARAEAGRPQIDPADAHRFVMDGQPWYPAGYYASIGALLGESNDRSTYYRLLIDKQSEHGITLFRAVFNMGQPYGENSLPYERTGPGNAADGKLRFDLTRFNESHFDFWRTVVTYARSKDVVVQLCIFDSWHNKRPVVSSRSSEPALTWGMNYDFYAGENNINGIDTKTRFDWHNPDHPVFAHQKAMVRKVVDELGDLPNIIFEISNENYSNADWELQLANYLTACEKEQGFATHLVMPRDLPNHDSAGGKQNDPAQTHREMVANYLLGKPLIADNDGGGHVDPDVRRQKAWAALTAGGHVDYFHSSMRSPDVLASQDVTDGMRYIGNTRRFLNHFQLNLAGMMPSDKLVSNGWCYCEPGKRYIIYLREGGATSIMGLPEKFDAHWFNPRTAKVTAAEGGPNFTAPDQQDWVLLVRAAAAM